MTETREKFEKDLAEVDWKSLRIHTQRDSLILVDTQLDLVDVACRVADDDTREIGVWIEKQLLCKPTAAQLSCWEAQLDKPFKMLIAAPYILLQAVLNA